MLCTAVINMIATYSVIFVALTGINVPVAHSYCEGIAPLRLPPALHGLMNGTPHTICAANLQHTVQSGDMWHCGTVQWEGALSL